MSSDDESTTVHPEPRYQLRSNTQSFELISLSSRSSWRYHQTSTAPSSASTTPTRNSGLRYITSTLHQSPFGRVNQWGTLATVPAFTPSLYISLQVVTSTPIYTMEVNTYVSKPFSSTTHCCYRKHSSHHWCNNFYWSNGGILLSSWAGISGQKF
jgi:hypothetical protein